MGMKLSQVQLLTLNSIVSVERKTQNEVWVKGRFVKIHERKCAITQTDEGKL